VSAQRARTTLETTRQLQRTLYRAAKVSPARRFHALYDKVYREDILARAWQEVKTNAGVAGVDAQTIEQIEQQGVAGFLAKLAIDLQEECYHPRAVRRVRIPSQTVSSDRWAYQRYETGSPRQPRSWSWSPSSKPVSETARTDSDPNAVPIKRWSRCDRV